jgi:3-oxoacyl-[acyl-carrier-protein] synthase-3
MSHSNNTSVARPGVTIGPITIATGALATTNDDLAERFGRPSDVIYRKIGIHSRPLAAPDMAPKDLATQATLKLFDNPVFNPADLAVIITASSSVLQVCPPVSCEVLAAITARRPDTPPVMAFDIMATCPGWLYAIALATDHLHQPRNRAKTALIITTEIFTQGLAEDDFGAWASFGDAATATVLYGPDVRLEQPMPPPALMTAPPGTAPDTAPGHPYIAIDRPLTFARPDTVGALWGPPLRTTKFMHMDGPAMRAESMPTMALALREALADAELTAADLDLVLAHQSNQRILADLAAELPFDPVSMPTNLPYRGNTSSSALPLLIHDMRAASAAPASQAQDYLLVPNQPGATPAPLMRGQNVGFTSFGGGFTYAAAIGKVL